MCLIQNIPNMPTASGNCGMVVVVWLSIKGGVSETNNKFLLPPKIASCTSSTTLMHFEVWHFLMI